MDKSFTTHTAVFQNKKKIWQFRFLTQILVMIDKTEKLQIKNRRTIHSADVQPTDTVRSSLDGKIHHKGN